MPQLEFPTFNSKDSTISMLELLGSMLLTTLGSQNLNKDNNRTPMVEQNIIESIVSTARSIVEGVIDLAFEITLFVI